jgi:hypothetical protein
VPVYTPVVQTQTQTKTVENTVYRDVIKEVAPKAININLPKQAPVTATPFAMGIPCTPDKKCMGEMTARLKDLIQEINTIQSNVTDSFQIIMSNQVGYQGETYFKKKVRDYKDKKAMYDRLFKEAEITYDRQGGKVRKQTLLEYVILLFYISYVILAISYSFYSSKIVGNSGYGALGFMFAMIFPITVFLIYIL